MPKDETNKKNARRVASSGGLLVMTNGKKSILVPRPVLYEDALRAATRHFGGQASHIALQTRDLDICDATFIDISPEAWDLVKADLKALRVTVTNAAAVTHPPAAVVAPATVSAALPTTASTASSALHTTETSLINDDPITLTFARFDGVINLKVKPSARLDTLFKEVHDDYQSRRSKRFRDGHPQSSGGEYCEHGFNFFHNGWKLGSHATAANSYYYGISSSSLGTVASAGLQDGDHIDVHMEQKGGKPVIYLYAPQQVEATVRLSLTYEWGFSVVYPVVPVKKARLGTGEATKVGQAVEWRVQTQQDGTLRELSTGLDVAYLYWEARTEGAGISSPPPSPSRDTTQPTPTTEVFSPATSSVSDGDSVLLAVDGITLYLDAALAAMGLHTEARTSFITYWLPALLKHKHVALRFVNQAAYERAAPLEVVPAPDVVTRVFMLFKGVDVSDGVDLDASLVDPDARSALDAWPQARARANEPPSMWKDVVGVQLEKTFDASLFRVIEWGGMEVLH
ncbi:hypothetical protein BD626DRAFT_506103 [Schizophyllum amplum]|uniref:Uncharacterized protein n=1 Tax=Schizophyllum amplum TaxID=97359 RepID=A0A550C5E0_9AGAR|nr:hypothetical protein BD626DRAFT_506103 [Auriculariopsis ampla]